SKMSVRIRPPGTEVDRPVLAVAVAAIVAAAVGAVFLAQAAIGGRPDYRTVQIDNQSGLPVQVDVAGPGGGRLGLGAAGPGATTTFEEVADQGGAWTFVVSYGGQEVQRQPVGRQELAARGWTFQVPADVTVDLERQGYR
ncbi:MAG TPA: hypothetical protein VG411_09595, partial [Actinomycetota bacterium]|nr:hypothetical protein [Actinomycetota bacterium]